MQHANLSLCSQWTPRRQNREPMMPSPQFIKSYFSSFTDDIISQPLLKGEKKDEDKDKEGEAAEVTGRSEYLLTQLRAGTCVTSKTEKVKMLEFDKRSRIVQHLFFSPDSSKPHVFICPRKQHI